MVNRDAFSAAAKRAITNIIKHGDTDIFPFSFETHAFFDKQDELINLVAEYNEKFDEYLTRFSPEHVSSLTPVTYSGFRWATQLDPIWNVYILACVISLARSIETVRLPVSDKIIFSYRYRYDKSSGNPFSKDVSWVQFMRRSIELSRDFPFCYLM
jgi:hypothetical protein